MNVLFTLNGLNVDRSECSQVKLRQIKSSLCGFQPGLFGGFLGVPHNMRNSLFHSSIFTQNQLENSVYNGVSGNRMINDSILTTVSPHMTCLLLVLVTNTEAEPDITN